MKFQKTKIRGYLILLLISMYVLYSLFLSEYFIQLPSYIKEAIFIPLFFIPFLDIKLYQNKLRITYSIFIYALILIIYSLIGIVNHAPDVGAIRYYLFPLIAFIMVRYYMPDQFVEKLLKFYFFFYLLLLMVGYYQIYFYRDKFLMLFLQGLLGDEFHTNRIFLFYSVPTIAGTVLGSIMILFFLLDKYKKWLFVGMPVLIFCFSRSSIIAIIVSIFLYYAIKFRKKTVVIAILTIFLLILISLSINYILTDAAFLERLEMSKDVIHNKGINILGKGIGFVSVSSFIKEVLIFDNDFLRFVYEVGIIGLFFYLFFIFSIIRKSANKEMITYILFFFILMYTGDIHSMYPIPIIIYTSIAMISRKAISKDII